MKRAEGCQTQSERERDRRMLTAGRRKEGQIKALQHGPSGELSFS